MLKYLFFCSCFYCSLLLLHSCIVVVAAAIIVIFVAASIAAAAVVMVAVTDALSHWEASLADLCAGEVRKASPSRSTNSCFRSCVKLALPPA